MHRVVVYFSHVRRRARVHSVHILARFGQNVFPFRAPRHPTMSDACVGSLAPRRALLWWVSQARVRSGRCGSRQHRLSCLACVYTKQGRGGYLPLTPRRPRCMFSSDADGVRACRGTARVRGENHTAGNRSYDRVDDRRTQPGSSEPRTAPSGLAAHGSGALRRRMLSAPQDRRHAARPVAAFGRGNKAFLGRLVWVHDLCCMRMACDNPGAGGQVAIDAG
ncbi:hypothetical protein C8Q77DRAFT_556451 [Trametes polyzona]|nr:hypothetical protein C8Q77DRAFT_556451 [Trametes polyzona]